VAGTLELVNGQLLLFRFPYNPEVNSELRDVTANRVRWDPQRGGFTLALDRLRRDPSMIARLTRFIDEREISPDTEVRKVLAIRRVVAGAAARTAPAGRTPRPGELSHGQLRCDLLPSSTWGSNLRGVFSRQDWDALRIPVCAAAGHVCEVCGSVALTDSGRKRRPDCHELWIFEERKGRAVQLLDRLIALCPDCHRAQHIGLAGLKGETHLVIAKLQEVNGWTAAQAQREILRAQDEYGRRQAHSWDLDLSALRGVIAIDGYPDLYFPAHERACLGNSYYRAH
jgi:5-methylcytosine-specific restriction endonuclease McrA